MKRLLCPECERGEHVSPPNASLQAICTCSQRTCACYGVRVAAGLAKERT